MIFDKEFERLKRDKNYYQLEYTRLNKKSIFLEEDNKMLLNFKKIFETIEMYLPHRIEKLKELKDERYSSAILELQKLYEALEYERKKIENEEEYNEEKL